MCDSDRPGGVESDVNAVASFPLRRAADPAGRPSFGDAAQAHLDDVFRYLLYLLRDPSTAEELTAETFERALRLWPRYDPRRSPARTWLCQLARTVALDHLRGEARRRRREEHFAREQPGLTELEDPAGPLSPVLRDAFAALNAAEREVVALRVILELDGDEAARVLGISRTACSTRLSRALRKLAKEVRIDAVA